MRSLTTDLARATSLFVVTNADLRLTIFFATIELHATRPYLRRRTNMQPLSRVCRSLRVPLIFGASVLAAAGLSSTVVASAAAGSSSGLPGYSVTTLQLTGGAGGVAVDPATGLAYVGTLGHVDVIDEATGAITDQISIGPGPGYDIAVDAATDTVYVATHAAVDVIDGATSTVTDHISLPNEDVVAITLDPSTGMVYAADDEGNGIVAISTTSDTVVATTSLGTGFAAFHLAMNPGTDIVYAGLTTSSGAGAVWALDGSTLAVDHTVSFSGSFPGIDVDPATGTIYVTDQFGVYAVNGSTYSVSQISSAAAAGVAVDSASGTLIVGENSSVDVLDGTTGKVITTVPVLAYDLNGHGIALDTVSGIVFATNRGGTTDMVSQLTPGSSPTVTSSAAATFRTGRAGTFTITTSGSPTATVALTGKLPAGVSFTPSSSGTAVLAGTPATDSGGLYQLTVTAANGVFPAASQAFALTVEQAPSIASPGRAVFHSGRRSRFLVISRGFPDPHLREMGRLPRRFTFLVHSNGTATLAGEPVSSQAGRQYVIKIIASNGVGRMVTQSLTIVIRAR